MLRPYRHGLETKEPGDGVITELLRPESLAEK